MKKFKDHLKMLREDASPPLGGASPPPSGGASPPSGGMGGPPLGMPPIGASPPPMPIGGGMGGPPPMGSPPGGAGGSGQPAQKLKAYNVWDALEKVLGDEDKEK